MVVGKECGSDNDLEETFGLSQASRTSERLGESSIERSKTRLSKAVSEFSDLITNSTDLLYKLLIGACDE